MDTRTDATNAFSLCKEALFSRFLVVMAASKDMQMSYNLCTLLKNEKTLDIKAVQKSCEMKAVAFISKSNAWNPFSKGKCGRDLSSEMMIPKHITTEKSQYEELKALK